MAKVKVVIESDEPIKVSVTRKDDESAALERLTADIKNAEGTDDEDKHD